MADTLIEEAPAEEAEAVTETTDERPEWLPEKYKTPEDFAKGHAALEKKFGKGAETAKAEAKAEFEAGMLEGRPDSKGDYKLPESIDADGAIDNDLLNWWAEHSFDKGYDQDTFEAGIQKYADALSGNQVDIDAESAKLGDNASSRIEAASLFASKFFPEDVMPAISRMCETSDGIVALEHGAGAGDTEADLKTMMKDERYWNPMSRDEAFVKKVNDGFKTLYG